MISNLPFGRANMKYMTDAQLANVSKIARAKGIDCDTVHKLMLGNEESQVSIADELIREFLLEKRSAGFIITLITNDKDLAGHCRVDNLPLIYVPDLIVGHILTHQPQANRKGQPPEST